MSGLSALFAAKYEGKNNNKYAQNFTQKHAISV
jgi:hypothetical protein